MRIRQRCRRRLLSTPIMYKRTTDSPKWLLLVLFLPLAQHTHSLGLPPTRRAISHKTSLAHILNFAAKKDRDEEDDRQEDTTKRISLSNEENVNRGKVGEPLQGDGMSSISKDKAISALSQPANKKREAISALSGANNKSKEGGDSPKRTTMKRSKNQNLNSSLLPPPGAKKKSKPKKKRISKRSSSEKESSFSSLLPPPLPSLKTEESESLSIGLSSWEEFLGRADSDTASSKGDNDDKRLLPRPGTKQTNTQQKGTAADGNLQLPSISDLFPPDVTKKESPNKSSSSSSFSSSGQSLDGVLPVSELFYRSSQAITGEEKETSDSKDASGDEGDDEELPFSAEQSDELTTDGNKVKIRRNRAETASRVAADEVIKAKKMPKKKSKANRRNRGRKLVRRGMEMFLGGTPINADPPQRSVELMYKVPNEGDPHSWASAISLNTRDFGPLLHTGSAESMSRVELGLFCENFVSAAIKWDVCPKDLREIVKSYTLQQESPSESKVLLEEVESETPSGTSSINVEFTNGDSDVPDKKAEENDNILSLLRNIDESNDTESNELPSSAKSKKKNRRNAAAKGFAKKAKKARGGQKDAEQRWRMVGFALKFSIGVSKEELESGDSRDAAGSVMRGVLTRGITTFLKSKLDGLMVRINTLKLKEGDDGATTVIIEFSLDGKGDATQDEIEKLAAPIDAVLSQAMDDGDFALALAAAAKEETAWPEAVRDRVVEEFLLEDNDVNQPWEEEKSKDVINGAPAKSTDAQSKPMPDGASSTPLDTKKYAEDDIFGHEGVFFDYSESNAANAPFKGQLGPSLVDAVTARAVERPPRIIAIGDVHGCIDELQDLLRLCDYRPGDQVVFLGDLVSKGPDSISVVQMAREIGAIGVRGNHDFEVIRWHQAIKAGVDPPVVGSEHFHIASSLSLADMRWMYCQPWYMTNKELGILFVHAGFVSGIRLSKQNPRLMMNMRSILPDGTVTSKFFNNWPWARLWDGPQTVLFGHDADRGLQQYEHAIGLDTGCVYGGRLTACILPEKRLVSVSARREYFKYRRKHYD